MELTTPRLNRYIPHLPHPKQAAFLLLPHREILFGGAAGGGKSDALLMAALQYFDVPGYAAIILRTSRAALNLPGGLIPRSHEWLAGTGAKWSDNDKTWHSPEGATLTFGYIEGPRDRFRYASSEYQFIGFEELTEFRRREDYTFLFSRLRKTGSLRVPLRMRSTTNPIGPGYRWVKARFVDVPGTPRRCYLPSTLDDNPSLDTEEYEEALAELDPVTRAKLRRGDWSASKGGKIFRRDDVVFIHEAPRCSRIVRYWDLAASEPSDDYPDPDWTVGVKMGLRADTGDPVVLDVQRTRLGPDGVEALIRRTAERDGKAVRIRVPQDPGQAGKDQVLRYVRLLRGYDLDGIRESGSKEVRARPFAAQWRKGLVQMIPGTHTDDYLEILEAFDGIDNDGAHDDDVDASSGAYNNLTGQVPRKRRLKFTRGG